MKKHMDHRLPRVGKQGGEGSCFASQRTLGNIWLCLITLQIYDPGNNVLMLMILCEEKPEL